MLLFLWARFERAVVVAVDDVLGMTCPRAVRSRVVDTQVEGLGGPGVAVEECKGVIRTVRRR